MHNDVTKIGDEIEIDIAIVEIVSVVENTTVIVTAIAIVGQLAGDKGEDEDEAEVETSVVMLVPVAAVEVGTLKLRLPLVQRLLAHAGISR